MSAPFNNAQALADGWGDAPLTCTECGATIWTDTERFQRTAHGPRCSDCSFVEEVDPRIVAMYQELAA